MNIDVKQIVVEISEELQDVTNEADLNLIKGLIKGIKIKGNI